ncbi:MAG: hypothetical protein WC877_01115 [Dehalococcoidales bacterium]|jgi:hypothetical protein
MSFDCFGAPVSTNYESGQSNATVGWNSVKLKRQRKITKYLIELVNVGKSNFSDNPELIKLLKEEINDNKIKGFDVNGNEVI